MREAYVYIPDGPHTGIQPREVPEIAKGMAANRQARLAEARGYRRAAKVKQPTRSVVRTTPTVPSEVYAAEVQAPMSF